MKQKKNKSWLWVTLTVIWFIINIRVEAGIGSIFERAVDGLVCGTLLLAIAYYACTRFFGWLQPAGE